MSYFFATNLRYVCVETVGGGLPFGTAYSRVTTRGQPSFGTPKILLKVRVAGFPLISNIYSTGRVYGPWALRAQR